jgi:hypothetical protein
LCGQASVAIRPAGPPLTAAAECNLLEQDAVPVELCGKALNKALRFEIRPYEIRTFMLG